MTNTARAPLTVALTGNNYKGKTLDSVYSTIPDYSMIETRMSND